MTRLYGSLQNRMEENKYYNNTLNNIKVGDLATRYSYSDRTPYEVVAVKDQKHITIRELKAIRTDKNGMSDSQTYEFEQNEKGYKINLVLRNGKWYQEHIHNIEEAKKAAEREFKDNSFKTYEAAYNYIRFMQYLTPKQYERFDAGKTVKTYTQISISFGYADKYYDYSF